MSRLGYRSEDLYGEGFRKAADIIGHEIFELGNTDILDTITEGALKNHKYKELLSKLSLAISEPSDQEQILIDYLYKNKDLATDIGNKILKLVNEETGKDIKYALWLCDTPSDIRDEYEFGDNKIENIDIYRKSDIILSDIGRGGKLYGYEELPEKLKEAIRPLTIVDNNGLYFY